MKSPRLGFCWKFSSIINLIFTKNIAVISANKFRKRNRLIAEKWLFRLWSEKLESFIIIFRRQDNRFIVLSVSEKSPMWPWDPLCPLILFYSSIDVMKFNIWDGFNKAKSSFLKTFWSKPTMTNINCPVEMKYSLSLHRISIHNRFF